MAITDYASFLAKKAAPRQSIHFSKASLSIGFGKATSLWTASAFVGATPTTAAVPTNTTAGSLLHEQTSGTQRIIGHQLRGNNRCPFWVVDRLSHQGGLVGNVATSQTTNLPTAALTRYTDGAGVMIALEVYTLIGTTATTVSVTYTDGVNGGSRVSPLTAIGGTGFREVGCMILIPLQLGDKNPVSVQSVILTATTGTAGAFGVTLFRPLYTMYSPVDYGGYDLRDGVFGGYMNMPEVVNGACLTHIGFNANTGNSQGRLLIAED
jgi:hypothetical protein